MKVNIVVLNYNGRELLKECLPSIVAASKKSVHDCAVTVLDNKSSDESIEMLRRDFPEVRTFPAKENKVYSSYNEIAQKLDSDILLVMNNDIKVEEGFVDPLVAPFAKSKDIFFTAVRGYSFDGKEYQGDKSKAVFRWGILRPVIDFSGYEKHMHCSGNTFSAGIGAFDRRKFVELGGYDEIYLPGRYEDVDLCYRAWKRGWKGVYQPESVQYHKGGASFKKEYNNDEIERTVFRNSMIFMVKNITDPGMMLQFSLFTALKALAYAARGRFYIAWGYFDAIKKLPQALKRRKEARHSFVLSDRQAIELINKD